MGFSLADTAESGGAENFCKGKRSEKGCLSGAWLRLDAHRRLQMSFLHGTGMHVFWSRASNPRPFAGASFSEQVQKRSCACGPLGRAIARAVGGGVPWKKVHPFLILLVPSGSIKFMHDVNNLGERGGGLPVGACILR